MPHKRHRLRQATALHYDRIKRNKSENVPRDDVCKVGDNDQSSGSEEGDETSLSSDQEFTFSFSDFSMIYIGGVELLIKSTIKSPLSYELSSILVSQGKTNSLEA
jgi:hypothetical protein